MAKFEIEYMCEHIETVSITAKSQKEATQKVIENGEYDEVLTWSASGTKYLQSIRKV